MADVICLFPKTTAPEADEAVDSLYRAAEPFGGTRELAEFVLRKLREAGERADARIHASPAMQISFPIQATEEQSEALTHAVRPQLQAFGEAIAGAFKQELITAYIELYAALWPPNGGGGRKVA